MRFHDLRLLCLRYGCDIRRVFGYLAIAIILAYTGYGAWWITTNYLTAAAQIAEAKDNERKALALLEGRAQEKYIGDQYIIVTKFERKDEIFRREP